MLIKIEQFFTAFSAYEMVIAITSFILMVIFYFSWRAKLKFSTIDKIIKRLNKNLPSQEVDDFNLKTKLNVRFAQKIKNGIANIRELHGSSRKQDSEETIKANSINKKLVLKYKHVAYNEDRWISYAIKEFSKELLVFYLEKGYFIMFTACSDDLQILVFETRLPERKRYAFLSSKPIVFFCPLEDIISDIDKFEEICFVIRAFPRNKLEGKVQIYDFSLVKEIKCPKCGKKYKDLSKILCNCESIKKLEEGLE